MITELAAKDECGGRRWGVPRWGHNAHARICTPRVRITRKVLLRMHTNQAVSSALALHPVPMSQASAMQVIWGETERERADIARRPACIRTDVPTGTVSCYIMRGLHNIMCIGMACRYFSSHLRTWLQHYDSNAPLLAI